jgi:F0F1-type ATP synthase membrane subunit b/b'
VTIGNETSDSQKPDMHEIEADIARTREELADTVDALTARMDVKTRARDRVQQTKDQARDRVQLTRDQARDQVQRTRAQALAQVHTVRERATDEQGKPTPATLAAGGAAVTVLGLLVGLVIWRRRRS